MVCLKKQNKTKQTPQQKTQPLIDSYFCWGAEIQVPQADSRMIQPFFSIYFPNEQCIFDPFQRILKTILFFLTV